MSPRRKRSPLTANVEAIIWNDAWYENRAKLDISPVFNHSVGFVVHEDDKQVILAAELTVDEDWMEADMDYTKIPKPMIVKRTVLAEVGLDFNSVEEILTPKTSQEGNGPQAA